MRELTIDEIDLISGAGDGSEITDDEAMALSAYYAGLGGVATLTGVGAGWGAPCFGLSAGFAFYTLIN